ncbi:hypothetical protein [Flavobacterium sp. SM2513]|uniref:hypothetical protein n=1 Tax=Flavobacterium sp. SM2513 TaxID=3424766 RepID=UPI003D7F3C74
MSIEVPFILLILMVPIYFISKWTLRKLNFGTKKNRKYLAVLPTVILSPLLYVGLIYLWIASVSYYPSTDFDERLWTLKPQERYMMSEDLIESKYLIGKTKEEIIALLGGDYYSAEEGHIGYVQGFVPDMFNIDPDVLEIYFENKKAFKVTQRKT